MRILIALLLLLLAGGVWLALKDGEGHGRRPERTGAALPEAEPEREPPSESETSVAHGTSAVPSHELIGIVVDATGTPIEGAQLYVCARDAYSVPSADTATALTGADGRFGLRTVGQPSDDLVCRRTGYVPHVATIAELTRDGEIRIVLDRGGTIHGQVVDLGGRPLADVEVVARGASCQLTADEGLCLPGRHGVAMARAKTDAEGRFRLTGLATNRRHIVDTWRPGYVVNRRLRDDPRAWIVPGAVDLRIEMARLVVAVLGVRAHGVDYTDSAGSSLAEGAAVRFPPGYARGFLSIPFDRLAPVLSRRLKELHEAHFVVLGKQVAATDGQRLASSVTLRMFGSPARTFGIRFAVPGEARWDDVQWLDFSDVLKNNLGELTIVNALALRPDALKRNPIMAVPPRSWRIGETYSVFRATPGDAPNEYRIVAPAGKYMLVRSQSAASHDIEIRADGHTIVRTNWPRQHFVRIAPRHESGAPITHVGVYIRRRQKERDRWEWLHSKQEPLACATGEEWIAIYDRDLGPVEIMVKKHGFRPFVTDAHLAQKDLVLTPVMILLPGY